MGMQGGGIAPGFSGIEIFGMTGMAGIAGMAGSAGNAGIYGLCTLCATWDPGNCGISAGFAGALHYSCLSRLIVLTSEIPAPCVTSCHFMGSTWGEATELL